MAYKIWKNEIENYIHSDDAKSLNGRVAHWRLKGHMLEDAFSELTFFSVVYSGAPTPSTLFIDVTAGNSASAIQTDLHYAEYTSESVKSGII